ncbi:BCCT family transporter [Streptomyces sp. TRM68367]|uniref:BCCT family transporter n=1 Tax=Streptomyces sp. TRM68367 TaxID=2758415 RepID=UPI00165A1E0C|nr:BCCT family transporter [Streptomyces sp. TRM68367]MBC9726495.1 BCCT family transporter [Streptomyces sp. TRM68367]
MSGADAASVVLGMLSWAVLLLAGGLEAVKQVAIIAAFPFLFVMIGLCVSLVKALRAEPVPAPSAEREGVADTTGEPAPDDGVRPAESTRLEPTP